MIILKTRTCWSNNYSTRKKRRDIEQNEKRIIKIENYKISKLLNNSTASRFLTKKWVEVNNLSSGQYSVNKNTRFKTIKIRLRMLRSDLCDNNDAYIVVGQCLLKEIMLLKQEIKS